MKYIENPLVRERMQRGLNQTDFWGNIGVSQSCGSRYESGRPLPEPVAILVDMVYTNTQNKAMDRLREMRRGK